MISIDFSNIGQTETGPGASETKNTDRKERSVVITATKYVDGKKVRGKKGTVSKSVESFRACRRDMTDFATSLRKVGFTVRPITKVDFEAVGIEDGKSCRVEVIARYADGVSKLVKPVGDTSIVLTRKVLDAVFA